MNEKKYLALDLSAVSSLPDQVCNSIRLAIFKGDLQPGDRLIQEEIAASLSVSRMPIREALQKLEAEGLIETKPNRGAVVKKISIKDVEDTYELRSILEKKAVIESVPRLTPIDIIELESLVKKMEIELNKEYILLNQTFHRNLMMYCTNQKLMQIINMLWDGISSHTPCIIEEQMQSSNDDHNKIMLAIKEENFEEVGTLIGQHILETGESLVKFLREKELQVQETSY